MFKLFSEKTEGTKTVNNGGALIIPDCTGT